MTHSTNNVPLIHTITSFETMTRDEGFLLYRALVLADANQKSFTPGLPLRASDNPAVREYVRIPKQIILRRRMGNVLSMKWDVYEDEVVGKGEYAGIKRIKGTLIFDYQLGMRFIPKAFAAKEFLKFNPEAIINEYSMTKIMNGLSVKRPTLDANVATMVMEFVSGENLRDLLMLKDRSSNSIKLTTDERLLITKNLIVALRDLHQKGIFHRDIKPENIMIELPSFAVKIVDYGFSVLMKNMPDGRYPGTPWYAAPEVFEERLTINQSADIFSLGQVIPLIFRADFNSSETIEEAYHRAYNPDFNNLFEEIEDLDLPHQDCLKMCMDEMIHIDPKKRASLDFVLMCVEEIIHQRCLTRIHAHVEVDKKIDAQLEAEKGAREGVLFQYALDAFANAHPILKVDECPLLAAVVSNALDAIPDTEYAVSAFVERARVAAFNGLASKFAIEERLTDLMVTYKNHVKGLTDVLKQLNYLIHETKSFLNHSHEANEVYLGLLNVRNDLEMLRKKMDCPLTPDNILRLNGKASKHIEQTKSAFLYFRPKLEALKNKQKPEIPLFKSYFFEIKLPEQGPGEAANNLMVIPKK